jgi:uncharacterized protein (DUF1778 family)
MKTNGITAKRERLEARATSEQKELLQRAADLTGRSVSDFVISSAVAAAEETVRAHEVIQLTARDTKAFAEAFLNPRGPNDAMRKHARRYRELVERE